MKTLIRTAVLTALLMVGVSVPSYAQLLIDTTTLTSAITATTTTITLAAVTCTNCTFGQDTLIMTTDGEAMRVTGAYTAGSGSLTVQVRRGTDGTLAWPHANALRVYYGPPSRFHLVAPGTPGLGDPHGTCTRATQPVLPWINVLSGNFWNCDGSNTWRAVNAALITYNSTLASGAQ